MLCRHVPNHYDISKTAKVFLIRSIPRPNGFRRPTLCVRRQDRLKTARIRIEAMDRTQAAEIKRHMLDAADAIDRASKIILALDKEDRAMLAAPLGEIVSALHFQLLQAVYIRYPDLR